MKAVLLKGHGGFEQLAGVHPLAAIVLAQQEFLAKGRMGKIILVP
jgi:hypothetical protein